MAQERMTRRDAQHVGIRVEYLFGPIRVPSREAFVEALATIVRETPLLRVGADISPDRRRRISRRDRAAEWAESAVETIPGDGLENFVTGFGPRVSAPPSPAAMHFTLTDRHVLFSGDHSLGDSGILMRMAPAVIAVADGEPVPDWLMRPEPRRALSRAVWHTLGMRPRAWRAALAAGSPAVEQPQEPELRPWTPDPRISTSTITNERFGELRRAYKKDSARVPATIALMAVARAALEAESIDVKPLTWVPIDARRYLPDGVDLVGNFAPPVPVSAGRGDSAVAMSEQLARSVDSGRPLLSMVLSSLRPAHRAAAPLAVPVRPRADVVVTTVGIRQEVDGLPWQDRRDSWFFGATAPGNDPLAICIAIAPTRCGATITASYHGNVFSPRRIDDALARLATGDVGELVERYALRAA
ncbi:MAG: hypothetical protein QM675_05170 [Protaetiibacter sp.]